MIAHMDRRAYFAVPALMAVIVVPLGLLLMAVGARSPYTHVNLDSGGTRAYARSEPATVGETVPFRGEALAVPLSSDLVERGKQLFVSRGCASCHGLTGTEGIVGPVIAGTAADVLKKKADKGPGGMPPYDSRVLTDDDLNALAAYLKSVGK